MIDCRKGRNAALNHGVCLKLRLLDSENLRRFIADRISLGGRFEVRNIPPRVSATVKMQDCATLCNIWGRRNCKIWMEKPRTAEFSCEATSRLGATMLRLHCDLGLRAVGIVYVTISR